MRSRKWFVKLGVMVAFLMMINLVLPVTTNAATGDSTEFRFPAAASTSEYGIEIERVSWYYLGNIFADDTSYVSTSLYPAQGTLYLVASDFGFAADTFPVNAEISGVEVVINRASYNENSIQDYRVKLFNVYPLGENRAVLNSYWSSNNTLNYLFEEVTYGGSNDLWGLSSLSIETVTSSSFGVGISIINAADSSSGISAAFVDDIKIKLYYTVASLITPDLSLSEPASATYDGQPHAAIVTSTIEGSVTDIRYDGSADAPVQAGSYSVTADFTPVDTSTYESLVDAYAGTFVIDPALPSVFVTNSPVTYSGSPLAAEVSGSVAGAVSDIKYNGSTELPVAVGTYAVTADLLPTDTTNYYSLDDAAAGNFVIEAPPVIHTVTLQANPAEGGSTSGDGTYLEGARVSVIATPNPGYEFVNWTENSTVVSTKATYRFTLGTTDRTLVANFQAVGASWPRGIRLTATDITATSVTLTLSQPVPDATQYIVYYGSFSDVFAASDGTSLVIDGLTPSTVYVLTVQAVINGEETTDGPSKKIKTSR